MKKKVLIAVLMIAVVSLSACSSDLKVVGKWRITTVISGEVTMNESDLAQYGIQDAGYIKLQRSGKCVVNLLGDEYKGKWEMADDGKTITLTYNKTTVNAEYDGDKITLTDTAGTQYILEK